MLRTLPAFDQLLVGAERLVVRHGVVRPMREIEVDRVDLQPLQRILDRLGDIGGGEILLALPHVGADLGDDDHIDRGFRGSSSICR